MWIEDQNGVSFRVESRLHCALFWKKRRGKKVWGSLSSEKRSGRGGKGKEIAKAEMEPAIESQKERGGETSYIRQKQKIY